MDFYLEPDRAYTLLGAPYKLSFGKQLSQEISLPDFYEDLARVIDCSARAVISDARISDGVLSVKGEASYSILYYSDKDSILHRFFFEQEFEASRDADAAELLDVSLFCREPSVRIYGPRKLSVSLDCDFSAYLASKESIELPETENTELLKKDGVSYSYECAFSERSRFTEDFLIPAELPALEELVYWELCEGAVRTDVRADGLIVSSDASLNVIYTDSLGEYVSYKTKLPLTRLVHTLGADVICSDMLVYSPKCAAISDSSGENRRISLDFELCAKAVTYKNIPFSYAADAYCTDCNTTLGTKELSTGRAEGLYEKELSLRDVVENDGSIEKLLSVRALPELLRTRRDGDMLYSEGECKCTLLAKSEGGGMCAYEHSITFDVSFTLPESAQINKTKLCVNRISTDEASGGFEVKIDLSVSLSAFTESKVTAVTQINRGERDDDEGDCSMLIYYPDSDETLWDIGKSHRVSTERIASVNSLDTNELKNKKFILIPKK